MPLRPRQRSRALDAIRRPLREATGGIGAAPECSSTWHQNWGPGHAESVVSVSQSGFPEVERLGTTSPILGITETCWKALHMAPNRFSKLPNPTKRNMNR